MKKQLLLAAGFAVIMLFSCKKEEEPIPARFWPLAEGNQWTTAESYSWKAASFADSSKSITTNTVELREEREDGKLVWPVATTTHGDSVIYSRNYYYVTEDSIYIYSMDKDAEEPTAVEPNNLEVGTEWDGKLAIPVEIPNFSTTFPAHFKVTGMETVTVPAGSFNCLVVRLDIDNNGTTLDSAAVQWRADGIGIVKFTTDFKTQYSMPPLPSVQVEVHGISEMQSKTGF